METCLFVFEKQGEKKIMAIKLPIGTQTDVCVWSPLFEGFGTQLLKVVTLTDILRRY